jgi:hypothetical protein
LLFKGFTLVLVQGLALACPCMAASPPAAQAAPLIALVRGFYVPYLDDKQWQQDALSTIAPHATRHLQGLIQKDIVCEERTHEICSAEMNPIIDGMDWELNGKLPVLSLVHQNATTIVLVSRFKNDDDPAEVFYKFILEDGAWRIDDIWSGKEQMNSWDLVTMLSEAD